MPQTNIYTNLQQTSPENQLTLAFKSDQVHLHTFIEQALSFLNRFGFNADECGQVEIVLAEVLNNVIEHAYLDKDNGNIKLTIQPDGACMHFSIEDEGFPMPNGVAPAGRPQDLNVDVLDLPEGGFGWFLIRELTQGLEYHRQDKYNILTFSMSRETRNQ